MDVKDLINEAQNLTEYEFKQKLGRLVHENYRYRNLDSKNQKVVMDLVSKYKGYIRKGIGISSTNIRNEMYKLYQHRFKLDLTEEDLKDIKEILNELKK